MPTAITLRLIPEKSCPLAGESSPAHGWLLTFLQRADQEWSDSLHQPNQTHPYTVAPLYQSGSGLLWERRVRTAVRAGESYALRVTFLEDMRAAWLCGLLAETELPPLGRSPVRLERCPTFTSDDPDVEHCSWSTLTQSEPAAGMRLHFVSPTAFVSQREVLPRAEPERIWGSWRRSWEKYAPVPLENIAMLDEALPLIRRFELSTRDVTIKRGLFVGFVGWMELTWRSGAPEEMRRAACALARLAEFTGTGAKTGLGMGQTRVEIF